ncbi:MAG: hypothetical protein ACJ74C_00085 [Gaiellaceae bacterium]
MIRKALIGAGSAALVVLAARTLAYAAHPSPTARFLEQRAGGPAFPLVALVALTLGASIAIAVCWLASVAVRERALIEGRPAQSFDLVRLVAVAFVLSGVTCFAGGLLEAYIHWRAGLGWHGLHCLVGPVHRDLLPLETGLSLVAAAMIAGARHLLIWMRRTFARLAPLPLWLRTRSVCVAIPRPLRVHYLLAAPSARAPPVLG